jgi:ABC-type bacteriocin/lantibiotic exporters, contain an N-terminal double-glycine peptidase domain
VTALVGPSGSGKSTIIGLVAAFASPTGGASSSTASTSRPFGSRATARSSESSFRSRSSSTDDPENVAFSRPAATEAEVVAACRVARVDEFAEGFEKGYETVVGERGVKLSGGQRQRVSIARALLADPRILILDEATSSLDTESEAFIQQGLAELLRGRTTFVIAHRLSTIRRADQILVVEAGAIVERGRHDGLMAAGGRYAEMVTRQAGIGGDLVRGGRRDAFGRGGGRSVSAGAGRPVLAPRPRQGLRAGASQPFARASFTQIVRPSSCVRFRARIAFRASSSAISTKPYPLERPVVRSTTTVVEVVSPKAPKISPRRGASTS